MDVVVKRGGWEFRITTMFVVIKRGPIAFQADVPTDSPADLKNAIALLSAAHGGIFNTATRPTATLHKTEGDEGTPIDLVKLGFLKPETSG